MSKNNKTSACIARSVLTSLGRHAQLTRCFSAVAELLVVFSGRSVAASCDVGRMIFTQNNSVNSQRRT